MLKIQNHEKMFPNNFKMGFIPPMMMNSNQFVLKCIPQNIFLQNQDLYKGYTNSLQIKLPYSIDKTTLLNIFLFYGKIEYIDINTETNTILVEYYKIISAIKCYSEFQFNLKKLMGGCQVENNYRSCQISFVKKNFEEKFYLGIKIKEKELFKTKINTDCLIKILIKVGKILKIHQKMSYDFNGYQQQIYLNTIFVFNDSRDKEKADFILRRIISPYSGYFQACNNLQKFEETKECKEENKNLKVSNNNNLLNNNKANNPQNYDILFEQEKNLSSFSIIYQYVKREDEIELKDDYEVNMNKKNGNNYQNNNNYQCANDEISNNKENINSININNINRNVNGGKKFQNFHQSRKTIENSIKNTFSSGINKNKYTGIKQRNTPVEERAKYVINLEKIINEKDQRTTLMIKNIPRNIMQSYLMEIINKKFENLFNFFYLPIDFIKKENAGYAFINFKNSKNIVDFYIEFNEKPWPFCQNRKCFISYARIQGFRAITQHFSSSNIMLVKNGDVKPYISDE